jgi:hypothetical protein
VDSVLAVLTDADLSSTFQSRKRPPAVSPPARCLPRRAFLIFSSALPLYAQSSVQALNEAGWKALEAGNGRRALGLFNEAQTLRPNDRAKFLSSTVSPT